MFYIRTIYKQRWSPKIQNFRGLSNKNVDWGDKSFDEWMMCIPVYVSWKTLIVFYHRNCFPDYIFKYNSTKIGSQNPIKNKGTVKGKWLVFKNVLDQIINILNKGRGMSILDIRDMIKDDNLEIDLKNSELKVFLEEKFGNNTRFCWSESKNKSQFV